MSPFSTKSINFGTLISKLFNGFISLVLLLAAFVGAQSTMQVMAQATSGKSLIVNEQARSARFTENNYDKTTKEYTPKIDPTGISDASKEFNQSVSSAVSSLPTLPNNLASSASQIMGELLQDKTKTVLTEGKTLEIGEIKVVVEKATEIKAGDGKNLLSKDVVLQDVKKEEKKTSFEFGNPDQHLKFDKAVKVEIKTELEEIQIGVTHQGQSESSADGLSADGQNFKTKEDKTLAVRTMSGIATFWTLGASNFTVTPSSGTITITSPTAGATVGNKPTFSGTGTVNGAIVNLSLDGTRINYGTATVASNVWSITATGSLPFGSHTVCVVGGTGCVTFVVASVPPLNVTINQASTQADPANFTTIKFTAIFSKPINVASFIPSDVVLTGTAPGATVTAIAQIAPNDGTTFDLTVTTTASGTVIATIPTSSYIPTTLGATGTNPEQMVMDPAGNIYVTNTSAHNVSKITPSGVSSIFATTGMNPKGITIDATGNIYTANTASDNVSKITPSGVSSILGTTGSAPVGITIDTAGNIYASNVSSNNVSKITPAGVSTIFATTGSSPYGIIIDTAGNLYTANTSSNNVTKITPAGVSTIFGTAGTNPRNLAMDAVGNIYVTNLNSDNVTKITPAGVSTIFGTTGFSPTGIAIDISGNLFITNSNSDDVTKITPAGVSSIFVSILAGSNPNSIVIDSAGSLYTTNAARYNVTKIANTPIVQDLAGYGNLTSTSTDNSITVAVIPLNVAINQASTQVDPTNSTTIKFTATFSKPINVATFTAADVVLTGTAPGATVTTITQIAPNDGTTFDLTVTTTGLGTVVATIPTSRYISTTLGATGANPEQMVMDPAGNIYTTNASSSNVSKITPSGVSSIFATTGSTPRGITIDTAGNIYTANNGSDNVSKITPSGVSSILGTTGSGPIGITIDTAGNIYASNVSSNNVTKITPAGVSTIFATTGSYPISIIIDTAGNLYTANHTANTVTKITPGGVSTTLGTTGTNPGNMAMDAVGNIYVTNLNSDNVTKITPAGVSTIFGTTGFSPSGIAIDISGNLFITNSNSDDVTKITPAGVSSIIGGTGSGPNGIVIDSAGSLYTANVAQYNVTKIALNLGVLDPAGNKNLSSTSIDNTVTIQSLPLNATINQATTQVDPVTIGVANTNVKFTVTFDQDIDELTATNSDFVIGGTATGCTITGKVPTPTGQLKIYEITVDCGTNIANHTKTVTLSLPATMIKSTIGADNNASTSTDNTVTLQRPATETNCSDGIDQDGDGFIDLEDADCGGTYDLQFVYDSTVCLTNKITIALQIKSRTGLPRMELGSSNFRFGYDSTVLSNPTLVTGVTNTLNSGTRSLTGSTPGYVSLAASVPPASNLVPYSYTTIQKLQFDVSGTTTTSNLVWNIAPTIPATTVGGYNSVTTLSYPIQTVATGGTFSPLATPTTATNCVPASAPAITNTASSSASSTVSVLTNINTPTISGTGTAGNIVTVKDQLSNILGTTTVTGSGTWTITPTTPMLDGNYNLTATQAGVNLVSSAPSPIAKISIDTASPLAPVVLTVNGNPTTTPSKSTTPVITGTGIAGDTIIVKDELANAVGTTTVTAGGTWTITPTTPLTEGGHTLSTTATDPAGNISPVRFTPIVIDTTAPLAPVVLTVNGNPTTTPSKSTTPVITGTGIAGDTIIVKDELANAVGTTTVTAGGTWTITPTTPLTEGGHTLSTTATDPAGNISPVRFTPIVIDTTAPLAPVVLTVNGNPTTTPSKSATPVITGTGTAGDTIIVKDQSNNTLGTTTVLANGTWTITPGTALIEGSYTLKTTATDPAGNVSLVTSTPVVIDTTAPLAPVVLTVNGNPTTTPSKSTTPVIAGTGIAGDTIIVKDELANAVGTTTVTAGGTWTITPTTPLTEGGHTLSSTATDPAGNISPVRFTPIVIDTTAPLASVVAPTNGTFVKGTGTAGDTVVIKDNAGTTAICTVTPTIIQVDGTFSCILVTPLSPTSGPLSVYTVDPAGNMSTPVSVVLDVTAPVVTINQPPAIVILNKTSYGLTGTCSENGQIVSLMIGTILATTTCSTGVWSVSNLNVTSLPEGIAIVKATQQDLAGNSTTVIAGAIVDKVAPATPTVVVPALTKNTKPPISGTCETGSAVYLTILPTSESLAVVCVNSLYSVTPLIVIPDGQFTVNAMASDSQNNTSPLVSAIGVVDTTNPIPAVITAPISTFQSNSPTITGTGTAGDIVTIKNMAGTTICTTTVQGNGTWSCIPTTPLTNGINSLTPQTCDLAGNCVLGTTFDISVIANLKLAVKVILSNSYDMTTGLMRTKLRDANLIPTNQPYNKAPWNYTGTEMATNMPADTVDWVLIEIKNTSGVTVQRKAGLLKSNGTVIEADGSNLTSITLDSSIAPGSYKIIVSHRNHLAVATDLPVSIVLGQRPLDFTTFDFTTNVNVKGGNQTMLKAGVYGLRQGNIDGNNAINAQDRAILRSAVESVGVYSDFDLNLDGNFNSQDRAISRLQPDAIAML